MKAPDLRSIAPEHDGAIPTLALSRPERLSAFDRRRTPHSSWRSTRLKWTTARGRLAGEAKPVVGYGDGVAALALVEAAALSMASSKPVTV